MLNASDLREVGDEELVNKLLEIRKEIFDLRSQRLDSKTQKTHLIGEKRKEIARILTVQSERKKV